MLADVEPTAVSVAAAVRRVTVGSLRLAPVLGPHIPSPLGRLLRMPAVPFSALADPPFAVIHQHDVGRGIRGRRSLHASTSRSTSSLPGAITALQAIRRGRRLPVPVIGPDWAIARALTYLSGAPVPDHVLEMFHRGRLADNGRARERARIRARHRRHAT